MRKALLHILLITMLTTLLPAGCTQKLVPEQPTLTVRVYFPGSSAETKTTGATTDEQKINNFRLWVYLAEDAGGKAAGTCLGFLKPAENQIKREGMQEFSFKLDEAVAKAKPKVNVYALVNVGGAGINGNSLSAATTQAFLDAAVLQGDYFGTSNPVIPGGGIPYTACGKNVQLSGSYPVLEAGTYTLTRTVSKLRVVMCQAVDEAGTLDDIYISALKLKGDQIPQQEYLFNETSAPKISVFYEASALSFPIPSPIAGNPECDTYIYQSGMADQAYEELIADGIAQGVLSDCGVYYLRESDKRLQGQITYSIGTGAEKTVTFQMADGESFSRNHDWIVYLYFIGDAMQFSVSWTDWTDGAEFYITPEN